MARVKDLWTRPERQPDGKVKRVPNERWGKGKRWLAVWIGPDGREKSKAFQVKDRAKTYAARMEADVERGEYIDPSAGRELFGPLAAKWLRLRDVGAGSRERYESVFRRHVEPTFGGRQIKSVRPSEILEWLSGLAETHGHPTQAMGYLIVCGVFDLAAADGMRRDNPARSPIIQRPRPDVGERAPWPVERIWSVSGFHQAPYRAIPIISAGCGLRQGEALGLAIEDIDFEAGKVFIRRQLVRVGRQLVFKLPKGGKARTAPLSPGLARAVETHTAAYEPRSCSLPWMQENGKLAEDEHACALLFRWHGDDARTHDEPIRAAAYDQGVWKPALAAAGIIPGPAAVGERKRPRYQAAREHGTHVLRHYYATTLLDAGVSLAGVMEFMGHSKKGKPVTLGVYAHVTEETFEKARNAIDRSLFRLRAVQDPSSAGTGTELAVSQ